MAEVQRRSQSVLTLLRLLGALGRSEAVRVGMRSSSDAGAAPQGGVRSAITPLASLRAAPRIHPAILATTALSRAPPARGVQPLRAVSLLARVLSRAPPLPLLKSRPLSLTCLPCCVFFLAQTSISPTGQLRCLRSGWVLVVHWAHSPAHLCVRWIGTTRTFWGRLPAILGRVRLPHLLVPRLMVCQRGAGSVGGSGARHGLLRSIPLLR